MRRRCSLLATFIPRSTWDPAHLNLNWTDSYASDISDRRHWPSKRWSVGLEPRTPSEWLQFSYRNLSYAYNGALRACSSFPEMLFYYKEMKVRGVKMDVDTMNVLLSRAARFEHIVPDDIFLLFEELISLGARPDLASIEVLHTVLEHSAGQPYEWREARRRQLIELYNYFAMDEIERLAPYKVDYLLASQIKRVRASLQQLKSSVSPSVYRRYIAVIDSAHLMLQEVHNFLWEFVQSDHPAVNLASLQLRIPFVASVLKRPALRNDGSVLPKSTEFEDTDVCSVFQAAVERIVDRDLHDRQSFSERRLYLSLLAMLTSSGVLYTSDLMAQLMDIIKYSRDDITRDHDAMRLLRYALRASSSSSRADEKYRVLWRRIAPAVDARVVGRYIACRDPWSTLRLCFDDQYQFNAYPVPSLLPLIEHKVGSAALDHATVTTGNRSGGERQSGADNSADALRSLPVATAPHELRCAAAMQLRWEDVRQLIDRTAVLRPPESGMEDTRMEVFTGQMIFLRTLATGQRYGSLTAAFSTQAVEEDGATPNLFSSGLELDVWQLILRCVQEVHSDMEHLIAASEPTLEPEFECWEAMLVTLRCVLDFCVFYRQGHDNSADESLVSELFQTAATLRSQLVEESRTRFGGRMRILWLHEV